MFSISKNKTKKVSSTALSDFVNKSSLDEKKRVFIAAINQSNEAQNKIIQQAARKY